GDARQRQRVAGAAQVAVRLSRRRLDPRLPLGGGGALGHVARQVALDQLGVAQVHGLLLGLGLVLAGRAVVARRGVATAVVAVARRALGLLGRLRGLGAGLELRRDGVEDLLALLRRPQVDALGGGDLAHLGDGHVGERLLGRGGRHGRRGRRRLGGLVPLPV